MIFINKEVTNMTMTKARTVEEALSVLNLASSTAVLSELSDETLEFSEFKHKRLRNASEKLLIKKN